MAYELIVKETIQLGGKTSSSQISASADGIVTKEVTLSAAKSGQLTTRTSTSVGTLTMAGGHGITTGARLDIYFPGGSRRGVLVGTVATNSVPFTLGAGDDLPANLTNITAMVPQEEVLVADGDDVVGIEMFAGQLGTIVLAETDDSEILAKVLGGPRSTDNRAFAWLEDRDPTNPVAGDAIAKAFFSHGALTSGVMRVQLLID
ncbi:hypothetical protein [Planctomyces sp. SH-PL14]|uniref:hypothetical protein n=1 Tax=Planctomyces sp. SH-PL14 TaxID=1632864 RepID=UPI00078DE4BA|nr:hypothetical protein [Planctomyces sp. SH-PL14]AMV20414.1 hypothetical protein VT03_21125 [Planctomyces sp. SH-PL14]